MIKKVFDTIAIVEVLRRLATPFTRTKAYQLHLIDQNGLPLKKRSEFTKIEAEAFTRFDLLIFNLKRLIAKVTHSPNLAPLAAAALLLREAENFEQLQDQELEAMIEMFFRNEVKPNYKDFLNESDQPSNLSAGQTNGTANIAAYDPLVVDDRQYDRIKSLPKSMRKRKKPIMVVREGSDPKQYKFVLL